MGEVMGLVAGSGDPLPESEGQEILPLVGDTKLPEVRRSERSKLPRVTSTRGRNDCPRPKSPLMRMAEMRKGGLKGKALRQSRSKGFNGSDLSLFSGKKKAGGKILQVMDPIPEDKDGLREVTGCGEGMAGDGALEGDGVEMVEDLNANAQNFGEGSLGGLELEGCGAGEGDDSAMVIFDAGEMVVGSGSGVEEREVGVCGASVGVDTVIPGESELVGQAEVIPAGPLSDLALDLISAQPLQEMTFIGELAPSSVDKYGGMDSQMLKGGSEGDKGKGVIENFPSLSKDNLRVAKEKERIKGMGGREVPRVIDSSVKVNLNSNKEGSSSKNNGNSWSGTKFFKAAVADGVNMGGKVPVSFDPVKIRKMGVPGESCGLPSIQFSSAETSYLAEKMGFAIVGKFSHSIPSSLHIQRAFMGMKFKGEFSWKYINAKHVLIQFSLVEDYAKLLNGPNGMPVWFVDRHPMRVFKWTTDFDPFFESPIAAVWCNLIGLPIHLFEKSALFAIGGLLGEPLLVDHATISRSRLSFARLCIEIDISKTQVQEIILNIQGREIRQSVRWDRIPSFCHECKHVGHSSEVCYANGNREKPVRRAFNRPVVESSRMGERGADVPQGLGVPPVGKCKDAWGCCCGGREQAGTG